jgi:glutathione S-transferase
MSKLIVHGIDGSPFVRKVVVALAEKGIDFDLNPVMPGGGGYPGYLEISPLGKVPCLQEGDYTLPDSSCILQYLERTRPDPALYPSDAVEYGRALWYEEYADTRAADMLSPVFSERLVKKLMKQEPDEARVQEHLTEKIPPVLDYLEKELGDREWIVGARFSVADIAVASPFVNFALAGEEVDAARWPQLCAYLDRIHGRPSFKEVIEREKAFFARV